MDKNRYKEIVKTADCYYYATKLLIREVKSYLDDENVMAMMYIRFLAPKITLSSLACEMYLKALIYRKEDKLLQNGHDLKKLFERLDDVDKEWCKNKFNEWIGDKSTFDKELENIKQGFMQWRYLYEKGWCEKKESPGNIISGSISYLMELLYELCHKYMEDEENI